MTVSKWAGLALLGLLLTGCSTTRPSPDVSGQIRRSLDGAGLKNVSVSQDRTKGVVTLTGNTPADSDRSQAESIAKSLAAGQVVADEIAVMPPGTDNTRAVNSDLDKAIGEDLDAALLQTHMDRDVHHQVKNGVVTLTGNVNSQGARDRVAKLAAGMPNVRQVVNELQVKEQKASTSYPY
jgi:hyperosmotically inducible protein